MAIIERQLTSPARSPATPHPSHGPARLSTRTVLLLALAWVGTLTAAELLVPPAAQTSVTPLDVLVFDVFLIALGLTAVGLAKRRAWGGGASLGTSIFFLGTVFACPATGHHAFGLWWFGEFAAALALVAVSAVIVWRARRPA